MFFRLSLVLLPATLQLSGPCSDTRWVLVPRGPINGLVLGEPSCPSKCVYSFEGDLSVAALAEHIQSSCLAFVTGCVVTPSSTPPLTITINDPCPCDLNVYVEKTVGSTIVSTDYLSIVSDGNPVDVAAKLTRAVTVTP